MIYAISRAGCRLDTLQLQHQLRNLDRVQRRALQQLVRRDEHRDRVPGRIAEILADAADQDVVLARRVDRHRKVVLHPIVDDPDAWGAAKDLAHLVFRDRLLAFEGDGFAVGAQHRHPHAGHADADPFVLKDLLRLLDDLALFFVVAGLGIDRRVVVEQVERIGMRHHLRCVRVTVQVRARGFGELLHRGGAGAARGLIGRQGSGA